MSRYTCFLSLLCMTAGISAMQNDSRKVFSKDFFYVSSGQMPSQSQLKSAEIVELIDEKGTIPSKTLPLMPIAHSRCLSKKYPNALEHCGKGESKDQLTGVVELMHAAPESWRTNFLSYLGLKSLQAKDKFESKPLRTSLESYAMAVRLNAGLLKKYTTQELFTNMSRNELKVVDDLNNHFDKGFTSKQVYRSEYDRIAALPKGLRQQFHNKEEFFTLKLMPSMTDQALDVVTKTAVGGIYGAGAGAILGFGAQCGIDNVVIPAMKAFVPIVIKNGTMNVLNATYSGDAHGAGVSNMYKSVVENGQNIVDEFNQENNDPALKFYLEGFLNHNKQVIAHECTPQKFELVLKEYALQSASSIDSSDFEKMNAKAIKYGTLLGGASGFAYGVSTMHQPIVEESISKL